MHWNLVERPVSLPGDPDGAVGPPPYPDPTQPQGWDKGVEAYKAAFGEEAWARYGKSSYPRPMPADSPEQRSALYGLIGAARTAFGGKALRTRRRATHTAGIMAHGAITVVSRPEFPEHPFFTPGRRFDCRLRHANASFFDDAAAVVRGCALKFADSDRESPLDLLMNSGPIGAFWNLESFMYFVQARVNVVPEDGDWEAQRAWMLRRPMGLIGTIESARIGPSSFAELSYYAKIVFLFQARDGRDRYVKFRIQPAGLTQESGLLPWKNQIAAWNQARDPDDDRPLDYLRQELRRRVYGGKVEYLLQMQHREADPATDTHELFNMNHLWDPARHPWLDVAHVQLDAIYPSSTMEDTWMWLGHQPEGLSLLAAYSPLDYRSLGHARVMTYPASQIARELGAALHPPEPFGSNPY
ncbi:MAG: hypothetical protein AB7N76_21405 [Planctomycetota bacterium]